MRGCIAVSCAPLPLIEEAERRGIIDAERTGDDPTELDAALARLVRRADDGDDAAQALVARCGEHMARALAVVSNLLDVDRIVVGGPLWSRLEHALAETVPPRLDELRAARGVHPVTVSGTALGSDVGAIGAACLILDEALTPRPTSLLVPTA